MLEIFNLKKGSHDNPAAGSCAMEVVAWLAGERHSDKPACACPVIGAFVIRGNDQMDDATRQRLKEYIPRITGSRDPSAERARAEHFAWAAITVFAPIALDRAGLHDRAEAMRGFDKSLGLAAARAAVAAVAAARAAIAAARAAARSAEEAEAAAWEAEAAAWAGKAARSAEAEAAAWAAALWAARAAEAAEAWSQYFEVLDQALSLGAQGSSDYDFTPRIKAYKQEVLRA